MLGHVCRQVTTGRQVLPLQTAASPPEFGGTYLAAHCNGTFMVLMFMSLQNSWGPYNTATLYRSVERTVGHSVTWVCAESVLMWSTWCRGPESVAAGDCPGVPFTERAEPHTVAQCTVLV